MLLAQLLAFTPIAFLVLIGVVQGISPSLEEAAQTLRARRWTTFRTVSLPLMRPGLANAFLLGFVESMADFGNPLVLGGNFEVLSTKIFFAVVGAAHDQGARRRARRSSCSPSRSAPSGCSIAGSASASTRPSPARATPACRCRCRGASPGSATRPRCRGRSSPRHLRDHPRRRLREDDGPRPHADARALPHRLPHRDDAARGVLLRLGLELVLRRRSRSRRSRRRSRRRSACSPPGC